MRAGVLRLIYGGDLYREYLAEARDGYWEDTSAFSPRVINRLFDRLVMRSYRRRVMEELLGDLFFPGGLCRLGQRKIYVRTEGQAFPCERVPSQATAFRIGDVSNGFDMDAIMAICEEQVSCVEDMCVNCWNIRTCEIPCNAIIGPDGRISRESKSRECAKAREQTHRSFVAMSRILERDEGALEFLNSL